MDHQRQQMNTTTAAQAYLPFMLAVKGQLKTVEMSLLRYDAHNLFLSKPESAPPVEQRWRVAPLRWSAEREPFCVLTHRETNRLRLVVAKPDSACELWPVMYSSDSPDGGVLNCSLSPARCKLVSFMWQNGLYLLAMEKGGLVAEGQKVPGAVLQINAPQEPWVCVRDSSSTGCARITPFYFNSATYMLVQEEGYPVEVREVVDPASEWKKLGVSLETGGPLSSSKVQFVYCRTPPQIAAKGGDEEGWPLAVFAVWIDGCIMHLAEIEAPDKPWNLLCCVPVPPHQRIGTSYVPFLPEPLLVTTSMDPHYVGSVAVRRLFLAERLLAKHNLFPADQITPPRVIRYMQVPALPVSARDLTADLPITDLPFREYAGEFVGRRLPYDLTPENVPVLPLIPPPPRAASHGPLPLLLTSADGKGGASMASLQGKQRLDYVPGLAIDAGSRKWKVTPLRWAPGREVLFVLLQSAELRLTRVAVASPDKPCEEWLVQMELSDATVPFSESVLTPFQYQTVPGSSDLFVLVVHQGSRKGGLFFVPNPKAEWQFIRELKEDESDFVNHRVTVMYHRSKDAQSVNLCTFFLLLPDNTSSPYPLKMRVLIEPNQPSFPIPVPPPVGCQPPSGAKVHILYTFAPKPPVTHVWPCEVFACWVHPTSSLLTVVHVSAPDAGWRVVYTLQLPQESRAIMPVYLPYLAEPLLLVVGAEGIVDLLRLNLIETISNIKGGPKFVLRYLARGLAQDLVDTTLDTALVWIPQMGLQGMHPYAGYPLPFEKEPHPLVRKSK
jgi:hypothetical protein